MSNEVPIRNAATIIVLRDRKSEPKVLMGQRGKSAVFMPGKFVFPGGAIDPVDETVPVSGLDQDVADRLGEESSLSPEAIFAAAIRELWEETGLMLGTKGAWSSPPQGWRGFAKTGHIPRAAGSFFFRAVTPHGKPRRFDARFILADAKDIVNDLDDFSRAEDELSHLQWIKLSQARSYNLPFITKVVLAELTEHVKNGKAIEQVPFFRNDDESHLVTRLGSKALL